MADSNFYTLLCKWVEAERIAAVSQASADNLRIKVFQGIPRQADAGEGE